MNQAVHQLLALGERQLREDAAFVVFGVGDHGLQGGLALRGQPQPVAPAVLVGPHAAEKAAIGQAQGPRSEALVRRRFRARLPRAPRPGPVNPRCGNPSRLTPRHARAIGPGPRCLGRVGTSEGA